MLLTVRANVELLVCMPMPEAAHGARARQAVAGVAFSTEAVEGTELLTVLAPGAVSTEAVEGTVDRAPAAWCPRRPPSIGTSSGSAPGTGIVSSLVSSPASVDWHLQR